jgi:hypothetical protein
MKKKGAGGRQAVQLRLEDFYRRRCPYCEEKRDWHKGSVILYLTEEGEWRCFANEEIYWCEDALIRVIRLLKRLFHCATSKGLRVYATSYLSGGPNFIHTFGVELGGKDSVEWPEAEEFQGMRTIVLRLGFRTHREAVENLEKVSRQFHARVSQEVLEKAMSPESYHEGTLP